MVRVHREIVIDCPVDEVFDFLADGRNDPLWNREDLHMEKSPDGPVSAGTTFEGQVIFFGRRDLAYRIVDYEQPRAFSFEVTKPPMSMQLSGRASFEPVPAGTRMCWDVTFELEGLFKLGTPLIARALSRRLADSFSQIKQVLESRQR